MSRPLNVTEYGNVRNFPPDTSDDEVYEWACKNYEETAARTPELQGTFPDVLIMCNPRDGYKSGGWKAVVQR